MSEMALMTPVSSQQYIEETRNLINTAKLTFQDWRTITKSFVEYCLEQDKIYISLPQSNSYQSQRILRETLRNTWLYN